MMMKSLITKDNMNYILSFLMFIGISMNLDAQDWTTYEIKNTGTIDIPSTLELRNKDSFIQKFSEITRETRGQFYNIDFVPPKIVFQPVGMNNKPISQTYSRVLIFITQGKQNDFLKYDELSNTKKSDLDEFFQYVKTQNENEAKKVGITILKHFPYEIVNINGISAFKTAYTRRIPDNPAVYVESYLIFNNDIKLELTMSYRVEESEMWASDFTEIIKRLKLTKR